MKILVTGAGGMLGRAICEELENERLDYVAWLNKTTDDSNKIFRGDLTDFSLVDKILKSVDFEAIIHCAALTDVNYCESNKTKSYNLHVKASEHLAKRFPDSRFVYVSTDSVYGGIQGNSNETSLLNPVNYYAFSKLIGEERVQQNNKNYLILRTNIYGMHSPFTGKSLAEWALLQVRNRQKFKGYGNVKFNPVYVGQLAKIIVKNLIFSKKTGIYNIGSEEIVSKFDFLREILLSFYQNDDLIEESFIESSINGVPRPLNTSISVEKFKADFDELITLKSGIIDFKTKFNQYVQENPNWG